MLQFNFSPFPELSTDRLILRKIQEKDVDALFKMRSDREIMKFIPRPLAEKKEDIYKLIDLIEDGIQKNESINWAIALKESDLLIGTIGFVRTQPENHRAEVGYMLSKEHHGKGYTYEALCEVVDFGFKSMKLHSIEAIIDPENIASEKLLLKCSFIKEGHLKENEYWDGKYLDTIIYSRINN